MPKHAKPNSPKEHPPKTHLAIRVGVTGHRPNHLKDSDIPLLRKQIHHVLQSVRNAGAEIAGDSLAGYDSHDPIFRVISPLAEGSDRSRRSLSVRGYLVLLVLSIVGIVHTWVVITAS